ncbi:MAG TPA: DMT family protein [Planctomicrobium sp.]|nr:DMT family protein [Planctomicrobium sp.]
MNLSVISVVVVLLIISNIFMTFAWYGHLKDLAAKPWLIAVVVSWLIAFFEYLVQVPANRYGFANKMELGQLKIIQEVVTLAVFVPFSVYYMQRPVNLNFLWAGLCMCGAVYFIFRS